MERQTAVSIVVGGAILAVALFAFSVQGQERSITFPIPELGNCASKDECRAYCDDPANTDQCLDFAVAHGLMSQADAEQAKQFLNQTGPGGCKGEECRDYCEDPAHRDECLDFAVEQGLVPAEVAQEVRRFPTSGPGGCQEEACREYCDNPGNAEECLNFAVENNLIPVEAAEQARRMLRALAQGGPGGCQGEDECRDYCENPANQEACFAFAEQNGLIPPEELERAKKGREILVKIETEGGPGGCRGEDECRLYCSDPTHTEECVQFAVQGGFMTSDEARRQIERFQGGEFDEYRERFEQNRERFEEEFRQKREEFEERFRAQREEFEGRFQEEGFPTPDEFPGFPGQFPGPGEFPPPQEFPGLQEFPGQTGFPGPSPEELQRYEEQFRQFREQSRPDGFPSPEEFQQYEQYQGQYPPPGSYQEPPPDTYQEPPLPTSSLIQNLPAFILNFFRFR